MSAPDSHGGAVNHEPLTKREIDAINDIMAGRSYVLLHIGGADRAFMNRMGMSESEAERLMALSLNLLLRNPDRAKNIGYSEGGAA
ncbi:hypothetical protein LO749_12010 [Paracoccus denitrificans]|uniref:hypothetical protein n=1 Tax=Paracoccus denitrificans TaxID=266 RepID=UPI001E32F5F3|nr:hypothetical protein [Paracoccus denitrificans]UFS64858.1 hypothetical protein LO749_12010 [Paracoccus denitrificans]